MDVRCVDSLSGLVPVNEVSIQATSIGLPMFKDVVSLCIHVSSVLQNELRAYWWAILC